MLVFYLAFTASSETILTNIFTPADQHPRHPAPGEQAAQLPAALLRLRVQLHLALVARVTLHLLTDLSSAQKSSARPVRLVLVDVHPLSFCISGSL